MKGYALLDLAIRGARIIDGTGLPSVVGDLGIVGEKISAIGDLTNYPAKRDIGAAGLVISPGFIDTHTHDDAALLAQPFMECKVSQGVTTVITGNCGVSLAPLRLEGAPPPPLDAVATTEWFRFGSFAGFLQALRSEPASVNAACLVGHGTMRAATMPRLDRAATADECLAMARLSEEAIDAGAIGLSSGLFYPIAAAAPKEEVAALVRLFGPVGGVYAAHIRDEADAVAAALDEAFWIAREGRVPLIISHHKVSGKQNHGRSIETLTKIVHAATGQPVSLDAYPYTASSTMLNPMSWAAAERTVITWCKKYPEFAGRDLAEVAHKLGISEENAITELSPAGGIFFMMNEADVQRILQLPATMIGSDGVPFDAHPHPRLWGTFTRILGHYVRDVGLFGLEEAVRRMTSLPAAQFRLADRGILAPGAFADLVLFDAAKIGEASTFEHPTSPSLGIISVFNNGQEIWTDGRPTGNRPGKVLTHS